MMPAEKTLQKACLWADMGGFLGLDGKKLPVFPVE
jgi:hypothetical protein